MGHDDLTVPFEGGGKVFSAIAEAFPSADVFTSLAVPERLAEFPDRKVLTTFMQGIPFKRKLQKVLFCLYPLAFESLDLSDYDLVISSSARFAHGVITRPETKHVCYMHSPGRMFWESDKYFVNKPWLGVLLAPALSYLRLWDYTAAQRVDQFVANSKNIARKIKRYYGREAIVIYPFVDLDKFQPLAVSHKPLAGDAYFLIVTRLEPWKRVEIAVEAAQQAGANLKIVGRGPDRRRLERLADVKSKKSNGRDQRSLIAKGAIEILGGVGDEELVGLYQNCSALIMTQEEDFGITSLEAQACGRPVIAYGAGGSRETVIEGKTGEFFFPQTAESLAEMLKKFKPGNYDSKDCRRNAERFSRIRLKEAILKEVENVLRNSQKTD